MAEAFGVAAAAISLITVAKECLALFHEFRSNTPASHRVLRFRLEAEAIKFKEWCDVLGVQQVIALASAGRHGWEQSPEMEEFKDRLRSLLRFDNERAAQMTIEALGDMFSIFKQARSKLLSLPDLEGSNHGIRRSGIKRLFIFGNTNTALVSGDRGRQMQAPSQTRATQELSWTLASKGSAVYASVKWVALDKKTFKSLLDDISTINECLGTFLAPDARARVARRVQTDILQMPKLRPSEMADLLPGRPDVQNLARVAETVRSQGELEDGTLESTNVMQKSAPATPTNLLLDVAEFESGSLGVGPLRAISSLAGRRVLVEWTYYSKGINLDHLYRRGGLARLLKDTDLYHKFGTLSSPGMVTDATNNRLGLVFEIPSHRGKERSLLDLFRSPPLPVDQRLSMAKRLAAAMHTLQSVGWLHKSIRSDNLIWFEPCRSSERELSTVRVDDGVGSLAGGETPELYLMGWYLSRPDQPSELSQTVSFLTQGCTLTKEMVELYSHPETLQPQRPRFKLEYDIYSFGLVLLEIGLWKSVEFLRQRCSSDDEFRAKAGGAYCDMLRHTMGTIYWRATKRCLLNIFDRRRSMAATEGEYWEEISLPLTFERQVVSELERCVC
ncbi:hypothetical protein V8F20_012136 [Naviculisporaceae sp. PSN 640]